MKKHAAFFIIFTILGVGCRKDEPIEEIFTCPDYEQTITSYSSLKVTNDLNETCYQKEISTSEAHIDQEIDVNCDGIPDFKVIGTGSSDYYWYSSVHQSNLSIEILNSNFYVLTTLYSDSLWQTSIIDTVGTTIYFDDYTSNTKDSGAVLLSATENRYVKGVNLNETIYADSGDWQSSSTLKLMSYYKYHQYYTEGPDGSGYYTDATSESFTNYGIINDTQYIAFKYIGGFGIKLGYISFSGSTWGAIPSFEYKFIRGQR